MHHWRSRPLWSHISQKETYSRNEDWSSWIVILSPWGCSARANAQFNQPKWRLGLYRSFDEPLAPSNTCFQKQENKVKDTGSGTWHSQQFKQKLNLITCGFCVSVLVYTASHGPQASLFHRTDIFSQHHVSSMFPQRHDSTHPSTNGPLGRCRFSMLSFHNGRILFHERAIGLQVKPRELGNHLNASPSL